MVVVVMILSLSFPDDDHKQKWQNRFYGVLVLLYLGEVSLRVARIMRSSVRRFGWKVVATEETKSTSVVRKGVAHLQPGGALGRQTLSIP
jgi:hypothetical protein